MEKLKETPKETIRIVEVGPRDGLQNESVAVSTDDKIEFIQKLATAGLKTIEATSFVAPSAIPQLSDADDVIRGISRLKTEVNFPCLVPNLKGYQRALDVGVEEIAFFTATSTEFCKKNINATPEKSLERIDEILAHNKNQKWRGYVSTVFGCPYEGVVNFDKTIEMAEKLIERGAYEISLGDTIGVANPKQVKSELKRLLHYIPANRIALHFHDTRGAAVANVMAGLEVGIRIFDSSAGGLGGCPYAKGASGNLATEDLVRLCDSMGIETGVDLRLLAEASNFVLDKIGRETVSKVLSSFNADPQLYKTVI